MPVNTEEYITCRNCGKYTEKAAAINAAYCSTECTLPYRFCGNCGKYFTAIGTESLTCSEDCAVIYKIKLADQEIWSHLKEA